MRFRSWSVRTLGAAFDVSESFRDDVVMTWTEADYRRLGDLLRAERRQLGYRLLKDFQTFLDEQDNKEMSGRTYADIEAGKLRNRKKFSSESLAFLEDLFGWKPGVTRSVLDGNNVDVHTGVLLETTGTWGPGSAWKPREDDAQELIDSAIADVDERFLVLERRVLDLERRLLPQRSPRVPRRNEGGEHGGDTAATKTNVTPLSAPAANVLDVAKAADADERGEQSAVAEQGEPDGP